MSGTTTNPELWQRAAPVLPSHDLAATAGFWGSLGFAIHLDDGYLRLVQGGTELHYVEQPDVDPFTTAWLAYLWVGDVDLLHADLHAADVMPDGEATEDELRARWESDRDLARLGVPRDSEHGMRELTIFDPTNNQVTCGHALA